MFIVAFGVIYYDVGRLDGYPDQMMSRLPDSQVSHTAMLSMVVYLLSASSADSVLLLKYSFHSIRLSLKIGIVFPYLVF